MRSSFIFFFFLVIFAVVDAANIVTGTCQEIANGNNTVRVHVDFCVKALEADPKSKNADRHGLGIISLNLVVNNAGIIGDHIVELLKDKTLSHDVHIRLNYCQAQYSEASFNTREAIVAFNSKDYSTANIKVGSVLDVPYECENGFREKPGLESPLTAENSNFVELAAMALAFTNLVY